MFLKNYFFGVEGLLPLPDVFGGLFPLLSPDGFPVLLGQFLFELLIFLICLIAYYFYCRCWASLDKFRYSKHMPDFIENIKKLKNVNNLK